MKRIVSLVLMLFIGLQVSIARCEETPALQARCAIVIDADTGAVLYEKNADDKAYPASTTKLLTVLLGVLEGDLSRTVLTSQTACDVPVDSSLIPLTVGETISFRSLLYATMICSGNDGAQLIAETISGSTEAFVAQMNQYAALVGCTGTHFSNANGYHDPNHYTTAHDMARIAQSAMQNAAFRQIAASVSYDLPQSNMNGARTLRIASGSILDASIDNPNYDARVIGIKSGFHGEAGYCFIGAAAQDGRTLITAVLDSTASGRWTDTTALLDYGFAHTAALPVQSGTRTVPKLFSLAGAAILLVFAAILLICRLRRRDRASHAASTKTVLTGEGIDTLSEFFVHSVGSWRSDAKTITRIRLTLEEILLNERDALGETAVCTLTVKRVAGHGVLTLSTPGACVSQAHRTSFLMTALGMAPTFAYHDGINSAQILWTLRPHRLTINSLIALVLSIVLLAAERFLPSAAVSQLQNHVVEPMFTALMHLVTFLVGPFIFLTVVNSLCSRTHATSTRTARHFFGAAAICGLLTLFVCMPLIRVSAQLHSISSLMGGLTDVLLMLTQAFPVSIFSPFADGNMLQILFLALLTGGIMRFLLPSLPNVHQLFQQALTLVRYALQMTMNLTPLLLFLCVQRLSTVDLPSMLQSGGTLLLADAGLLILLPLVLLCVTAARLRQSPLHLMRQLGLLPITLLSSPSPLTTYPILRQTLCDRMKAPAARVDEVLPLGMLICKLGMIVHYTVLTLYAAVVCGQTLDLGFLLLCWITVLMFSIIYLPSAYGNYAILIALFAQLSMPSASLSLAIGADLLLGIPATACSGLCLLLMTRWLIRTKRRNDETGGWRSEKVSPLASGNQQLAEIDKG